MFDELGIYRILAEAEQPASVERFVRQWLGDLVDYDERTNSVLVATLGQFLEAGRRQGETAAALVVHAARSSTGSSASRGYSGHDLSVADTCFNLQLAIRAWQTLRALRASGS